LYGAAPRFDYDQIYRSGSNDNTVRVWDLKTGVEVGCTTFVKLTP